MLIYWKPIAALLLVIMAFWGGFKVADDQAELEALRTKHAETLRTFYLAQAAYTLDTELLRKAEARMVSLQDKIEEMEADDLKNPESARECLDARDTDQLRGLWAE